MLAIIWCGVIASIKAWSKGLAWACEAPTPISPKESAATAPQVVLREILFMGLREDTLRHLRHRAAGLGASAARLNAVVHITNGFARLRAIFADVGALGANVRVVRRAAQHEIGADGANLRAVEHQTKMVGSDVFSAHFQAVGRGHAQTGGVARLAVLDALLHLGGHWVVHDVFPLDGA